MIKITRTDGTVIELNGGDEIATTVRLLTVLDAADQVTDTLDSGEEHRDETALLVRTESSPRRPRNWTLNPPVPEGRWPDLIYLTQEWWETFEVLREHPDGITSEELAILLGLEHDIASGRANRLRGGTPLIRLDGRVFRLTPIGADTTLTVEIHRNPSIRNKGLGWDRFMARPLSDGRHQRRRG